MRLRLLILLSWLVFCFLFLVFIKLLLAGSLEKFYFYWNAVLWMFIDCLIGAGLLILVKQRLKLFSDNLTSVSKDFLILTSTIPLIAVILTAERIFILETLIFPKPHTLYNWLTEYLIFFITQTIVSFSCISYFYISLVIKTKERLLDLQRAQSEMQIKILQQNIEPHFLFNNLNVLASLIESNPKSANLFLDKLAELYRYILQTQNIELVPLQEELIFVKNYLYLLQERFGNAYNFVWQISSDKINGQMIVPTALQSLLENVVKHNAGDPNEPLQVSINLDENSIGVENEIRPKAQIMLSSGTGLVNLQMRYSFLTEKSVEIVHGEKTFEVNLPLLKLKNESYYHRR